MCAQLRPGGRIFRIKIISDERAVPTRFRVFAWAVAQNEGGRVFNPVLTVCYHHDVTRNIWCAGGLLIQVLRVIAGVAYVGPGPGARAGPPPWDVCRGGLVRVTSSSHSLSAVLGHGPAPCGRPLRLRSLCLSAGSVSLPQTSLSLSPEPLTRIAPAAARWGPHPSSLFWAIVHEAAPSPGALIFHR
jgi:hypothetical protein